MKRIMLGVLAIMIVTICTGPDIVFAKDTSSRIYKLEKRVDVLESQSQNKTGYASVSFISGWDRSGSGTTMHVENMWTIDEQHQFANADTSFCWEGRMSTGMDPTIYSGVYVPIQLPHGATIKELQLVYYDEADDGIGVSVALRRSLSTGVDFAFAGFKSTGISYTPQYASITSIDPDFAVVDNYDPMGIDATAATEGSRVS